MNEEQYRQICGACDEVLNASDATLDRTAIPWLHVIREHPSFLKDYEDLLGGSSDAYRKRALRSQAGWVRQLWRALRASRHAWFGSQTLPSPADVLFVSHLLDASHVGKSADFYFGDLPERIHAAGHSVVVALIDHSGAADTRLADNWSQSAIPHVILSDSLGIVEDWSLYRRLMRESARLALRSRSCAAGLMKRVFERASIEAISGGTRTTLRMFVQVNKLVARIQPKVMIVTYEGHAWEKLAFAAARQACPTTTCAGYQHAAIFRMQHSSVRKLQPQFNPDWIFAAGAVSKLQLESSSELRSIKIALLGSHRAADLKNGKIGSSKSEVETQIPPGNRGQACLVLPEGMISECFVLFEFSLRCALQMPEMRFIWRLHPLVTFQSLTAKFPSFRRLPENIELSQMTLEEDIARVRYACYRGSTAIVKAVCAGVQPVYLERLGEMTIDPLYQLEVWRRKVSSPAGFKLVIEKEAALEISEEQAFAIRYCESFYTPLDPSVLLALLPNE